ncbi:unnamed protein product [Paramecium sonneborni]|uniref:Uncharacterized protein n=1 Tax=Paramecium sonneborni TaxID=65129 RepID=A0A8S1QAP1_9CILI|nr:unnamed protein product [Paramecium sonneborni]
MLKFRIFLWRYQQNKQQKQTFFGCFKNAHQESKLLYEHFSQLNRIPKQETILSKWKKKQFKQEIQDKLFNLKVQVQQIKLPHLSKQQILDSLKLYNLSIQALLEGKREVVQNDKFVFQDGQSLQQKVDKIKDFLMKITNQ